MDLPTRHGKVQWAPLAIDDRVDFRGAAAAADADRLIFLPPLAPLAARWAFTIVLSIKCKLSRDFDASVSKIRFQIPRLDQRLKRPSTVAEWVRPRREMHIVSVVKMVVMLGHDGRLDQRLVCPGSLRF